MRIPVIHCQHKRYTRAGLPERTYREETSLKNSENDTKRDQLVPLLDKAEADHCDAPQYRDRWEKCARSQLSQHDGGWRLEKHV